jgi:5-methylcytosine-specific restriction endonuclease McrA
VVREVYERDAGQCTFVSADGKRCSERGFLELHHHDRPYARGGEATVENLRLVCSAHNALFAERDYGRQFMRTKLMQTRAPVDQLGPERVQA